MTTHPAFLVGAHLIPLPALLAAAPLAADHSPVAALCLIPLTGLVMYRLTIVMHDCTHATLFRRPTVDRRLGKFLGYVTGIDFVSFRERHWEHHQRYGEPGDPQGFQYEDIDRMSRGALGWHMVKPLVGLNLPHVLAESHLHPRNLARAVSNGEVVPLAAVQAVMAYLVSGAGRHLWLVLLAPVSAATVGLFLSQLRGIAEHGVREAEGPRRHVRSHRPEWAGRILLYGLNFNLHEEHHQHPAIPSCELPASASPDLVHKPSMWRTLATMLARQ